MNVTRIKSAMVTMAGRENPGIAVVGDAMGTSTSSQQSGTTLAAFLLALQACALGIPADVSVERQEVTLELARATVHGYTAEMFCECHGHPDAPRVPGLKPYEYTKPLTLEVAGRADRPVVAISPARLYHPYRGLEHDGHPVKCGTRLQARLTSTEFPKWSNWISADITTGPKSGAIRFDPQASLHEDLTLGLTMPEGWGPFTGRIQVPAQVLTGTFETGAEPTVNFDGKQLQVAEPVRFLMQQPGTLYVHGRIVGDKLYWRKLSIPPMHVSIYGVVDVIVTEVDGERLLSVNGSMPRPLWHSDVLSAGYQGKVRLWTVFEEQVPSNQAPLDRSAATVAYIAEPIAP